MPRIGLRRLLAVMAGCLLGCALVLRAGGVDRVSGQPAPLDAVVVGDSVTAMHEQALESAMAARGLTRIEFEARKGRRTAVTYSNGHDQRPIRSGVEVVQQLRQQGTEPRLWIIQLGANDVYSDLGCGCDLIASADREIGRLVDALGPEARVAWLTTSFRAVAWEANAFNEALRRRASVDPRMTLVGWQRATVLRPELFSDGLHVNAAGAAVLADLYADTVVDLLYTPPPPVPRHPRADRLGMS